MNDKQDIARPIWEMKHRCTDAESGRTAVSVDDTLLWVANAIAAPVCLAFSICRDSSPSRSHPIRERISMPWQRSLPFWCWSR